MLANKESELLRARYNYSVISCSRCIRANNIINKFLLVGDKFMPEMHLKQCGYRYSAYESFTKEKQEYQSSKEQEIQGIFAISLVDNNLVI